MAADNTTAPKVVNLFTRTPYESLTPPTTVPAIPATPEKPQHNTERAVSTDLLPQYSPTVEEIYFQRRARGGISKAKAAELCGVNKATWGRWESGKIPMPRATWAWFKAATDGGSAVGGPEWNGWSFYRGELCTPEGVGFTAGEVRSVPLLYGMIREKDREMREQQEEMEWLRSEVRELRARRGRKYTLGQIDVIGIMIMQLMHEYRDSEDPVIRGLAEDMWNLGVKACEVKVKVLDMKKAAAQ